MAEQRPPLYIITVTRHSNCDNDVGDISNFCDSVSNFICLERPLVWRQSRYWRWGGHRRTRCSCGSFSHLAEQAPESGKLFRSSSPVCRRGEDHEAVCTRASRCATG